MWQNEQWDYCPTLSVCREENQIYDTREYDQGAGLDENDDEAHIRRAVLRAERTPHGFLVMQKPGDDETREESVDESGDGYGDHCCKKWGTVGEW